MTFLNFYSEFFIIYIHRARMGGGGGRASVWDLVLYASRREKFVSALI